MLWIVAAIAAILIFFLVFVKTPISPPGTRVRERISPPLRGSAAKAMKRLAS